MVLIMSSFNDHSTDKVMDWVSYISGQSSYRLNVGNTFDDSSYTFFELGTSESDFNLTIDEKISVSSKDISSIWFRRNVLNHISNKLRSTLSEKKISDFFVKINSSLQHEYTYGKSALFACMENNKKILGNFRRAAVNKIDTLILAKSCGLDIPSTIVTNSKEDVENFIKKQKSIITKAIYEALELNIENNGKNERYLNYTEEITPEILKNIPDTFFPSLFQENLNKEIEIRTFFLDGKCYSMAIFSQIDKQTAIDFRKYNLAVNNRNVPYQLPETVEKNINQLMKKLDLNTGSLDIVKTKDGRFVFLEVNPIGQYGMTSVPCNYNLDKKIAEYLTNHDKGK